MSFTTNRTKSVMLAVKKRVEKAAVDSMTLLSDYGMSALGHIINYHLTIKNRFRNFPEVSNWIYILPDGAKLLLDLRHVEDIMNVAGEVYYAKEYSQFKEYLPKKGDVVLDVGAFVGVYSLFASKRGAGRVVALEPMPDSFELLRENLMLNKLTSRVTALPYSLSNYVGKARLFIPPTTPTSSFYRPPGKSCLNVVQVPVITLDCLVDKTPLGSIDLLKIDVEGEELNVLRGGIGTLEGRLVDKIVMEVHRRIVSMQDLVELLTQHSYKVQHAFRLPVGNSIFYARCRK